MENDQPSIGVADLADALADDPIETDELDNEPDDDEGQQKGDVEADEPEEAEDLEEEPEEEVEEEAEEPEAEAESEKYQVTIKNSQGEDETQELTLNDLAEGYMKGSDYSRKTQQAAADARAMQQEYTNATQEIHTQSAKQIQQLREYVIQSISPQLQEFTPQLAQTDPAKYVELQALQTHAQQQIATLDQFQAQANEQASQAEMAARYEQEERSRETLQAHVPDYGTPEYQDKVMKFANDAYGISQEDLQFLSSSPVFKDGGILDSGAVIRVINDAMQFRALESQKPIQMKKVKSAPRVIKPKAPKPKSRSRAAERRFKKTGSIADFAATLD